MIEAPSRRAAITCLVVALVLVLALVLAARVLAPERAHPPHVARPAADATQEHRPTLTELEVTMHDFFDTLVEPPTTTTTIPPVWPAVEDHPDAPTPLDNPDGFLACVRARESGGNYTIHELTGASQAAGAYQFLPSTWNTTALAAGRPDLVGIDPAAASPADQDAMAQALYAMQGMAPWGGGC